MEYLAACNEMCNAYYCMSLYDDLDKHFKSGFNNPTYSRGDQELIQAGVVPEWLLRGRKLLQGTQEGARCEKALDALKGLHAAVWPKVKFQKGE